MPLLSRTEILCIKGEIREATTLSHELLRETGRVLHEYRQTVERSRQLLEKSRELIARAKPDRWSLSLVIFQAGSAAHAISPGL